MCIRDGSGAAGVGGRGRDNSQPGALANARSSTRAADQSHHRETAQTDDGGDFFAQLASHWKKNYSGWSAWMLTPDLKLPGRIRLKESRRVPMLNGPIECRLFRFDLQAVPLRKPTSVSDPPPQT